MRGNGEQPFVWAIRYNIRAKSDIAAAWRHFAESGSEDIANVWEEGLYAEVAKLARIPTRWPIAEEDKLFRESVRRMLYRRTPGGPAYRVLFVLRQNPDDAPTVAIIHIRHAAQKPMTRKEAREIEAAE
ncbi:MAG: hypothetical protein ACRYFS_12635 [Janthinobacterium lividum]